MRKQYGIIFKHTIQELSRSVARSLNLLCSFLIIESHIQYFIIPTLQLRALHNGKSVNRKAVVRCSQYTTGSLFLHSLHFYLHSVPCKFYSSAISTCLYGRFIRLLWITPNWCHNLRDCQMIVCMIELSLLSDMRRTKNNRTFLNFHIIMWYK